MNGLSRRNFVKTASGVLAMGIGMLGQTAFAAGVEKKPNILYILADQWRASATGYEGDPNVKTPNLDRLQKQGVCFKNAVSVCPVCTPYRASLMTGQFPTTTGMFRNDLYLPPKALCMGEIFKAAGYETGYIGKWHLDGHGRSSFIPPERRQGFDFWKAAECDHGYMHSHYYEGNDPTKRFWEGYDAYAQTLSAQDFIRDHAAGSNPFLLVVSYGGPHEPRLQSPEELRRMYPPESLKLPANVPGELEAAVRMELCGYYAHCTALDRCVGDLLETLKQAGIAGQTIVVFTSDHGDMLGAHGIPPANKQYPYNEAARVPFLLRYPAAHGERGLVVKSPINTPDILPTLLGLSGVPVPQSIEGENLAGLVHGGKETDRAALIMGVAPFSFKLKEYRAIWTSRYTYAKTLEGPWLLFDNEKDPCQMDNLVNKAGAADLQKEMEGRLAAELKKVGDELRPKQYYMEKWGYRGAGSESGVLSPDPACCEISAPDISKESGKAKAVRKKKE